MRLVRGGECEAKLSSGSHLCILKEVKPSSGRPHFPHFVGFFLFFFLDVCFYLLERERRRMSGGGEGRGRGGRLPTEEGAQCGLDPP